MTLIDERTQLKDNIYLDVAKNIARQSRDENTQVGAVIVAKDGSPVSWGYNGTIPGFNDDEIPHGQGGHESGEIQEKVLFGPLIESAGDQDKKQGKGHGKTYPGRPAEGQETGGVMHDRREH